MQRDTISGAKRSALRPLAGVVCACAVLSFATDSNGQQGEEIRQLTRPDGSTEPIDPAKMKRIRTGVGAMLRAGKTNSPEERQLFDEYFQYRVAEMTWAENQALLPKLREAFKKQDLGTAGRASTPEIHDHLNELLLEQLSQIALQDKFHLVVRYNCMLLIGYLDEKEPDYGGANAVPLPAGLTKLTEVLNDQSQPSVLRVAALVGISRHAKYTVAVAQRSGLVKMLVELVRQEQPPADITKSGNDWLRRRAAEILGAMATKWPEANSPETVDAIYKMAAEKNAGLLARCDATCALGNLEAKSFQRAPLDEMAKTLAELVVAISQAQQIPAEHLSYYLWCVNLGIKGTDADRGLGTASKGDTKQFLNELGTRIDEMLKISDSRQLSDPEKIAGVREIGQQLQTILKQSSSAESTTEQSPVTVGSFPAAPK